ncbi:IS982 family transposase [Meiothermus granaticius]|uniref:Transposase DDE domain protein n=1 Tax=Meiothermus granaticius NBRC 107808 TaxID=1227551 RepID=A0A399FCP5_9DEIN|nr:IS982 family transposase [Meiothermus granaticius]RIH93536.1 Transposase DDE domain protein [Meiothermus granaticius NBRC 107808]
MSRPKRNHTSIRYYLFKVKGWLSRKLPTRTWWRNQKMGDAELLALHLARIHFKHPYAWLWWQLMRDMFEHLPSYTQAYTRLFKLLPVLQLLLMPQTRPRRYVIVDSQPIPACRWVRRQRCKVVGAWEGYSQQGAFYGFSLHAFVSAKGEIFLYCIRSANQHDYKVAQSLLEVAKVLGQPIKLGDKAYLSDDFVTPPKKNSRSATGWKAPYSKIRKRVETVFSQLVNAHIRLGQYQTKRALEVRVALTILAHNLKIWGIAD